MGRYIEYLLKYWEEMSLPSDRFTLYIREPLGKNGPHLSKAFTSELLQPKLTGLLWENLLLPRHAREVDVLFGPSYTVPLAYRGRCVVAIHSLNEAQPGTHPWWYGLTYSPLYRLSAQHAHTVIVPSQSVKQDMQEHYGIATDKIEVVPLGVDDSFRPIEDVDLLRSTRQRYLGTDQPYILLVDKLSERRNIPLLLEAFAVLKKRHKIPHRLLLFGPNHLNLPLERMASELGISDSVVQTDGLVTEHWELVPIYNAADLYVLPSSYEGFSLPILEAMACGIPVLTTNRAALAEIASGYALLVDDLTVEALSDAMARALNDPQLRQHLRARGLERARSFRWEDTARRTLELLRKVAHA